MEKLMVKKHREARSVSKASERDKGEKREKKNEYPKPCLNVVPNHMDPYVSIFVLKFNIFILFVALSYIKRFLFIRMQVLYLYAHLIILYIILCTRVIIIISYICTIGWQTRAWVEAIQTNDVGYGSRS